MEENQCIHCENPVPEAGDTCGICWDLIPNIFTCDECGETCYKKDDDFGGFVVPEGGEDDVSYLCAECWEIENAEADVAERYVDEGQAFDHFDDEYFEEQL